MMKGKIKSDKKHQIPESTTIEHNDIHVLTKLENMVSDFLIYEDSISNEDNQNLRQNIIDFFVSEIYI